VIIEFLLMRDENILRPLRANLSGVRTALAGKVVRLRTLMDEVGMGFGHTGRSGEGEAGISIEEVGENKYVEDEEYYRLLLGCSVISASFIICILTFLLMPLDSLHF
jgi:hypothetical protein